MPGNVGLRGAHVGFCRGYLGHVGAYVVAMLAHVDAFLAYVAPLLLRLCWPRLRVILAFVGAFWLILRESGVLSKNGVSPR